ncbi:ABC transporter substrate-binding protein [Nocardia sp. NPDC003482]
MPLLCLAREKKRHPDVVPDIVTHLKRAMPGDIRISNPELPAPRGDGEAADEVERMRDLLDAAATGFVRNHIRGRRLRFERFMLVVWLMRQSIDIGDPNPDRTLRLRLQQRGLTDRLGAFVESGGNRINYDSWWWRLLLWWLRLLTVGVFQLAVTGRVPVLSGRYRWFLRQRYLAPELSGTFVRFASRLTAGEWQKEERESLCLLLVHAFLEDLRRAYRLPFWQVWRRREMVYPVLCLDDIDAGNGGFALLALVNDVRNQSGLFDPLLVIGACEELPPDVGTDADHRAGYDATQAFAAYHHWQDTLHDAQRKRGETAWYLPIRIGSEQWSTVPGGHHFPVRPGRPAWWLSRWTRIGVPVVVLALVGGVLVWRGETYLHAHCGVRDEGLVWTGTECVGLSDGSFDLFQPSDEPVRQVEALLARQNRQAEAMQRAQPERPFITLVVLEGFTSSTGTTTGLTEPLEAVEGAVVAQARQLNTSDASAPIVRILLANAGRDLREGARLVEPLRALVRRDPSVVGVIGFDESRRTVIELIRSITTIGLPMVGSTLSADQLVDASPMYFQVAPQNRREAEVAAAFAETLLADKSTPVRGKRIRIYYSNDEDDIYSVNLRDDARDSFARRDFDVSAAAFGAGSASLRNNDRVFANAAAAGRDICSYDGLVFYAARGSDFDGFASAAAQCGSKAVLIGDDDVSAHVADQTARQHVRAFPYYYLNFANAPIDRPTRAARDFYDSWAGLFSVEPSGRGRGIDGYGALAYDAAQVIIAAAGYLHDSRPSIPLTPGTVWRQITTIHATEDTNSKPLEGVTGRIDYGGDITRNVPLDKPIAVLRVDGGEIDLGFRKYCGAATEELAPESWCPRTN